MKKSAIKKNFLHYLELYFRNFGNDWTLDDFPKQLSNHKELLKSYLIELEQLGIVELVSDERFLIKQLPSDILKF